ncbi:MAG TPA: VCBS repeat-containing protein, partial [Algoriphagus sp.]|nr:VCBS repeat-containing protein [Algoriphagus sp.]
GKTGLWRSLLIEDLDGDGSPELLAGNWGLNSRLQTESDIPVRVYFADFDQNGSVDPLMTFPIQGKEYPFLSRDELAGQMYRKKALFAKHESFSTASISDILTQEELSNAEIITAEILETQLFSLKNGKFEPMSLPVEVQFAPINSAISVEGKQGQKRLLLLGNLDSPRLKIGRIDANMGLMIELDSKSRSWRSISQSESGIKLNGEVTHAEKLGSEVWVGIRNRGLKSFKSVE